MKNMIKYVFGLIFEKWYMIFVSYKNSVVLKKVAKCGIESSISYPYNIVGFNNIFIGNHVIIGSKSTIFTTRARLLISDYVIFGPNVNIITGDHMSIPGRYMSEIKDEEKLPEFDRDVEIDSDVWIGANVTILKGVKIGRGSIVSSGSVVTKDVIPYSIVGGVPAKFIKLKWKYDEIIMHELRLFNSRKDSLTNDNIDDFYKTKLR